MLSYRKIRSWRSPSGITYLACMLSDILLEYWFLDVEQILANPNRVTNNNQQYTSSSPPNFDRLEAPPSTPYHPPFDETKNGVSNNSKPLVFKIYPSTPHKHSDALPHPYLLKNGLCDVHRLFPRLLSTSASPITAHLDRGSNLPFLAATTLAQCQVEPVCPRL